MDDSRARAASADHERRVRLNQRLRQAFIEGAEEDSRRLGRGLTVEELEQVLRRYPSDLAERRETHLSRRVVIGPSRRSRCPVALRSMGAIVRTPAEWLPVRAIRQGSPRATRHTLPATDGRH